MQKRDSKQESDKLIIVNENGQLLSKLDEIISGQQSAREDDSLNRNLKQRSFLKNSSIEKINRHIMKSHNRREHQRNTLSSNRKNLSKKSHNQLDFFEAN